ncbi:DUF5809 family protein [Haladaptatus sp. ZSTT2]|uniref:DUF5809 family protein n=1 Tax=Haladaptatus sp. ZSTT2 TaxID=3120515 RepID=UPI00300EED19
MHKDGLFSPETIEDAREQFEQVGPAAQLTVKETAKAMAFDREEYHERVTDDVVTTARNALFSSLLKVTVGTREEFDEWCAAHDEYDVVEAGSDSVDHVVWHVAPFANTVVAATFQNEEAAAVATLRRQAFGRIYRETL